MLKFIDKLEVVIFSTDGGLPGWLVVLVVGYHHMLAGEAWWQVDKRWQIDLVAGCLGASFHGGGL